MRAMLNGHSDFRRKLSEAHSFSWGQRIGLLFLNYITLVLVAGILCAILIPWEALCLRLLAGVLILYLFPPLVARLILSVSPIRQGVIKAGTADFFKWWGVFNLQMIFCRLPMLEELVRMVPGAYSAWLRLWGARIGRLTYWAAGTRILDRSFINIGDDVIFGAGVRLNPHVMIRNSQGQVELLLADIVIGDCAMIGGYSLLTTGSVIDPQECTRACLLSSPFSRWRGGSRVKNDKQPRTACIDPQPTCGSAGIENSDNIEEKIDVVSGDHGKAP